MRFVQPEPRPAAKDIAATSYIIRVTVSGVNFVLIERLTVTIERYLRISAEDILIARNNVLSSTFDLSCLIRYPKLIKKRNLHQSLSRKGTCKKISVLGTSNRALVKKEIFATGPCTSTQSRSSTSIILPSRVDMNFGQHRRGR